MREAEDLNLTEPDIPDVLRGVTPARPSASVARSIWYLSGYRAGRRQLNVWRGVTISLSLTMTTLVVQQMSRRATPANTVVVAHSPAAIKAEPLLEAPARGGGGSYARLLNELTQDNQHEWLRHDRSAANPYGPLPQNSTDLTKLYTLPFN